jgi:hypothetical protein
VASSEKQPFQTFNRFATFKSFKSLRTQRGTSTFREFSKRGNERRLSSPVGCGLFFDQESDLSFLRLWRFHQLADGGK